MQLFCHNHPTISKSKHYCNFISLTPGKINVGLVIIITQKEFLITPHQQLNE